MLGAVNVAQSKVVGEIVPPPVTLHVYGVGGPLAQNCCCAPTTTVAAAGWISSDRSVEGDGVGDGVVGQPLQALINRTAIDPRIVTSAALFTGVLLTPDDISKGRAGSREEHVKKS